MKNNGTDKERALALAIEIERAKIFNNDTIGYLIERYMYYQDVDSSTGCSKFDPWPAQKDLIKSWHMNRLNIALKARQLGVTWCALGYAVEEMLRKPGYTVVALSKKEDDSKELVKRMEFVLSKLPWWVCAEKKAGGVGYPYQTWESTAQTIAIQHPSTDVESRFIAMPAAQDSGRSFTASLVIIDEWAFQQWAREIWTAAFPTINRPTGGKVLGISTAKRGTLFEDIWDQTYKTPEDSAFNGVFLPWDADPRRTQEWYESTKKALWKDNKYMQEYPATPEEAFTAGELTAFPEFSEMVHVVDPFPIPQHWRRWMSCDNGHTDPFAWYWFAVDEDGQVYLYREYTRSRDEPKVHYSDQAAEVMARSTHKDFDGREHVEKIDFIVAGLDAWNTHHRDQSGKDLIHYYKEGGITFQFKKAIADRKLRKATVSEYLKIETDSITGRQVAKIKIFRTCKHLITNLPKLLNDENDPEKVADSSIDNQYDSFGYGLQAQHSTQAKRPSQENMNRFVTHKQNLFKKLSSKSTQVIR